MEGIDEDKLPGRPLLMQPRQVQEPASGKRENTGVEMNDMEHIPLNLVTESSSLTPVTSQH